jgi:hypothetical protein
MIHSICQPVDTLVENKWGNKRLLATLKLEIQKKNIPSVGFVVN